MLNLDREKTGEALPPISADRFLTKDEDCRRRCDRKDFEAVLSGRNPWFFMMMTGKKRSGLLACPETNGVVHYLVTLKRTLASTFHIDQVIIPPLSVFVGHGYLQHVARRETALID